MAELKFRQIGDKVLVERHHPKDFEYVGSIDLNYSPKTFDAGDDDNGENFDFHELEQIAAKLRELNGEPNTRALDERVKELYTALNGLWEHYNERYKTDPNKTYWEGKMDGMDNALSAFDDAFPAELKEKLKKSEDG